MRIGVTGSGGFVGGHLMPFLSQSGHQPVVLEHPSKRAVVHGGASTTLAAWPAQLHDLDAVVHLANRAHAALPPSAYEADVQEMAELLTAARDCGGKRIVYLSSVKAADGPSSSPYGAGKAAMEQLLEEQSDSPWTVIRPCLVHGPGMRGNLRRLVSAVEHRLPLPVLGVGNQRSMISVQDLCSAITAALSTERADRVMLEVAHPRALTTEEVVRAIGAGVGVRPRLVPAPPARIRRLSSAGPRLGRMSAALYDSLTVDPAPAMTALGLQFPVDPSHSLAEAASQTGRPVRSRQARAGRVNTFERR